MIGRSGEVERRRQASPNFINDIVLNMLKNRLGSLNEKLQALIPSSISEVYTTDARLPFRVTFSFFFIFKKAYYS